jgi:hypothetical protein
MNQTAATEAVVIGIFLVAIVFTWDGLVRRHIRLSRDLLQWQVTIRGMPAVLLGSLAAIVAVIDGSAIIQQLRLMSESCRASIQCLTGQALLPLVSSWPVVGLMIIEIGAFSIWLMGAFELRGPYRRTLLAPGVWNSEKDLVAVVTRRLQEAHLPRADDDVVLLMGREIKQRLGTRALSALKHRTADGRLDADRVLEAVVQSATFQYPQVPSEVARVVAAAIVEYYLELYKRVPLAYRWALNPERRGRRR